MTTGDLRESEDVSRLRGVGGWLTFLCVSLGLLTPLAFSMYLTTAVQTKSYDMVELSFEAAQALFAVFVAIALLTMRSFALRAAKIYFSIRLAIGFLTMLPFFAGDGTPQELIIGIWIVAVSMAWVLYLYRSKRVRLTYGSVDPAKVSDVFT